MKKVLLLLTMVLAFSLTNAQEKTEEKTGGLSISAYQNVESEQLDNFIEVEYTFNNDFNAAVAVNLDNSQKVRTVSLSLGYEFGFNKFAVTPSAIGGIGTSYLKGTTFYGLDVDASFDITKWLAISGKYQLVDFENTKFQPVYYAGLKFRI